MTVDAHAEPLGQIGNCALEPGVVERDEPAAVLADEVVVVVSVRQHALEPRLPVPDRDPLDESMLDQQVEHSVDARPPWRSPLRTQRVLDLDDAQRTPLRREQRDHPVTRPAAPPTGRREDRVNVLAPTVRRHRAKTSAQTTK